MKDGSTFLGMELGSTRIKAVAVDEDFVPVSSGEYTWASSCENGVWTYDLEEVWSGLRAALSGVRDRERIQAVGVSAMMHGYLAFDSQWRLLTPFRTWQNTMTGPAARELTELFDLNIPQRWSVAHLYQAILNQEEHVSRIAHITTLAGYVHYCLTGRNCVGVGDASGMFPIDSAAVDYDRTMLDKFEELVAEKKLPWRLRELLPDVLPAGADAGCLTPEGARLLNGLLLPGVPLAPPEGDAGTGMTATNAVAPRTGNVSAGTSIFAMVVLERPLSRVYAEVGVVTTPAGRPVAMVHCTNCTADMNAWIGLLRESCALLGCEPDTDELYTKLYQKSLEGEPDCGGVTVYNYISGESVTGLDKGRPLVLREPGSRLSLANFMRAQLYSAMATLAAGMQCLREETVAIDRMTGHGGLFKTPVVGQKYMAAALNAPVRVMRTAGEGGPYGMALLAAYRLLGGERSLEQFLEEDVFAGVEGRVLEPDPQDAAGFRAYLGRFLENLPVERLAAMAASS